MSGSQWLLANDKKLSAFGVEVADLLGDLFDGIHHVSSEVMRADFSNERYITVTVSDGSGRFSTFDSPLLTKLVLLGHKTGIRAGINAATHGYLRLCFVRVDRTGFYADRHPTLTESMEALNIFVT